MEERLQKILQHRPNVKILYNTVVESIERSVKKKRIGDTGSILGQEYPTCYEATKPMHRNY